MKTFNLNDRFVLFGFLIITLGMSTSWANNHILAGQATLAQTAPATSTATTGTSATTGSSSTTSTTSNTPQLPPFSSNTRYTIAATGKTKPPAQTRTHRRHSGIPRPAAQRVAQQCRGTNCPPAKPAAKPATPGSTSSSHITERQRSQTGGGGDTAVQGGTMAWANAQSTPVADIGIEKSYTNNGQTYYYVVNSINQVSNANNGRSYALVLQNGQLVKSTKPADQEYQADVTISPCQDMSCGDTQTTVLPPETLQQLATLTSAIHGVVDKKIDKQKEMAECKIDQDGNKLTGDDQINCFGKQILKKKSSEQLTALKDVIRKNIASDLGSLDPDKRAKALDELSTLADAVSTSDELSNYMENLQKFGQTTDRLLTLARQRADIPNLPPNERAAALLENNNEIDQAMKSWNNLANLCDFGMKDAFGLSCSTDETSMADNFRESVMGLARDIEVSSTNPYTANSNLASNGSSNGTRGNREQRWNINTGGANFNNNNRGFGNSNLNNSNFNTNNSGMFNRGFGGSNTTAFNSNFNTGASNFSFGNNSSMFGNSNSNIFQQSRFNAVNTALNNNSSGAFTFSPSSFTSSASTLNGSTLRAQIRPNINVSVVPASAATYTAPYTCQSRGPGYCVGGVS